jgi:D-3-phosphoglycerate dehydrogenase
MRVIAQDPFMSPDVAKKLGIDLVDLDELVRRSDYISLHLPKNKETEGMIGRTQFELMKDGVRIVNVARGGIIDEAALADALRSGKVAGAAVDVYSQEPVLPDNPLLKAPNVVTTPHLGASTEEAQSKVAIDVAQQMVDYFGGLPARSAVNMPAISAEVLSRIAPYLALAERMGALLTQSTEGRIESVNVTYSGEVASEDVGPITRAALTGILSPVLNEMVNYVNAPVIAEARGIRVTESRSPAMGDFTSLVAIEAVTDKGKREIGGTLFGRNELRIVSIDGYRIDVVPEGTMLMTSHTDRPGVVGKVGTTLGNRGINIGGMHVGREKIGSRAIMVLSVDGSIPEDVMEEIRRIDGIESAREISLEPAG